MALLARWRADQLTYEDTGGADACENGDGVAAWGIYEGTQAGNLATQATAGNRPIWNSSDGGYPSVSVTGSLVQRLDLAHSAAWVLTSFSWIAVVKVTQSQYRHIWGRGANWGNAGAYSDYNSGNPVANGITFHTSYNVRWSNLTKPDLTPTTWFVVGGTADATCIKLNVNRQSSSRLLASQTVNFGTNPLTLFGDGSSTGLYHLTGAAREFAFWDATLSENEMATEIDAAMTRWGITNTVTPPASAVRPSHPMKSQVIG